MELSLVSELVTYFPNVSNFQYDELTRGLHMSSYRVTGN